MELRKAVKIITFALFATSYFWSFFLLLNFGTFQTFLLAGMGCFISLAVFLLSHIIYIK